MAVVPRAGTYRQVGAVSNPSALPPPLDGDGGFTQPLTPLDPATWRFAITDVAKIRASERASSAGTVIADATHILNGRFHPGITTKTVIVWVDRAGATHTANVLDVRDTEGAGVTLELWVSEMPVP